MGNIFAGNEIVEIGIQIEKNGYDFYTTLKSYPGEYFAYMSALASEYVFTQKDKGKDIAKKTKSDNEAIDLGIGFEKDSILFYEGMKKVVPEYDLKIVDQLIEQEQYHLKMLTDLKHGV